MNSTVRFVHRPIPEEGAGGGESSSEREPVIDRDRLANGSAGSTKTGWFGEFLSRVFRVRAHKTRVVTERKLDPQRWLPKE